MGADGFQESRMLDRRGNLSIFIKEFPFGELKKEEKELDKNEEMLVP
ncbi:MAG: hypothetical protein GY801_38985 [bacterium]|nr:hypothetical protein [bacterium]